MSITYLLEICMGLKEPESTCEDLFLIFIKLL